MSDDDFAAHVQAATLRAFGLKARDAGLAPVPLRVRMWRRLTFSYRRGKAIDWRSYNAAEAEYHARQEAFAEALPGRMQEIAGQVSEGLPEGLRFEWEPEVRRE